MSGRADPRDGFPEAADEAANELDRARRKAPRSRAIRGGGRGDNPPSPPRVDPGGAQALPHLRAAAPRKRESDTQRAILNYLAACPGVISFRMNTGAVAAEHKGKRRYVRFGVKGMPDILGSVAWCWNFDRPVSTETFATTLTTALIPMSCRAGHGPRPFALEVKRPGAPLSTEQGSFGLLLAKAGWLYRRVESVDDVRRILGRSDH